jgi:hypothetical protein
MKQCRPPLYTARMRLHRTFPLINFALRQLRQRTSIDFSRIETEVICPEETQACGPLIHLEGQIDKAIAPPQGFNSLEEDIKLAHAAEVRHVPTIRYTLKNCIVHDAGFDAFKNSFRKKRLDRPDFLFSPVTEVESLSYCMSPVSHTYFGHWLQDALPTALLAAPNDTLLLDLREDFPHTSKYAEAAGVQPAPRGVYFARRLHVYQDFSQGPSKRARLAHLRSRLTATIPDSSRYKSGSAVYFRRGSTGVARLIENEDELIRALTTRGFEVFDLEAASLADIQQRFRHARIVVGVEGSQQCHLSFALQAGACMISLIPADRFTLVLLGYARAVGLVPGFLVMDHSTEGYRVDLNDLFRTLDLAEERLQAGPAAVNAGPPAPPSC